MNKNLRIIMAHREAQETVNRHTQFWSETDWDVLITCPHNSIVKSEFPVIVIGDASHHKPSSIIRFRKILYYMSKLSYDLFQLHEYDSICIGSHKYEFDNISVYGNLFSIIKQQGFKGHYFIHPPITMRKEVLIRVLKGFENISNDCEQCFWDRVIIISY